MDTSLESLSSGMSISWPMLIMQLVSLLIIVVPCIVTFVMAAVAILKRGKGWEVPVWLLLSFLIPIVFPILALIHFRKSKYQINPAF